MNQEQAKILLPFIVLGAILGGVVWAAVANRTQTNTVYVIDYINGTIQIESPIGLFDTVNTGWGANELYAMNQDVETTDAVTFATVDTGQGANELYGMNQDVETTDSVTYENITVTDAMTLGGVSRTTWPVGGGGAGAPGEYVFLVNSTGGQASVYTNTGNLVYGPVAYTQAAINWAMNNLTAGRDNKERVVVKGQYVLTGTILVPSYTILDLYGAELTFANTVGVDMINNAGWGVSTNTQIWVLGGLLKGNKANQASGDGIDFAGVTYSLIKDVDISGFKQRGIRITAVSGTTGVGSSLVKVQDNYITTCDSYGLQILYSERLWIDNNLIHFNGAHNIYIAQLPYSFFTNNFLRTTGAIDNVYAFSHYESVWDSNHISYGRKGIDAEAISISIFSNNMIDSHHQEGIYLRDGSHRNTFVGNFISDNAAEGTTYDQVNILGHYNQFIGNGFHSINPWEARSQILVSGTSNIIHGNRLPVSLSEGIRINGGDLNDIQSNFLFGSLGYGFHILGDANGNIIKNNDIRDTTSHGVYIAAATCDNTVVKDNRFTNIGGVPLSDGGTGTILNSVRACFIKELGTAAWVTTAAAPMGIDVDAANEGALAKIKLPDLHQVVRVKVWAVSNVTEAEAMRLEVAAGAGGDNEAWNAEVIAVVDKPSTSTNFTAGDVIYWTFTSADDADIADLNAGDLLQWCIYHEAAGGADCETDILIFGETLVIEYV